MDLLTKLRLIASGHSKALGLDWQVTTINEAVAEIEHLRAKIAEADYLLKQSAPTLALEALQ